VLNSIIQGGVPLVHVRLLADVLGLADLARSWAGRRALLAIRRFTAAMSFWSPPCHTYRTLRTVGGSA
jgi:hypothetical protein